MGSAHPTIRCNMAETESEPLLVGEFDLVFAPDDRPRNAYAEDLQRRLAETAPAAAEDPEQRLVYRFARGREFVLRTTFADSFDAIHTLFLLQGGDGVADFFKENNLAPRLVRRAGEPELQPPEGFLDAQRLPGYQLLKQAENLVNDIAHEWTRTLAPKAAALGIQRLDDARREIETEAARYLAIQSDSIREALQLDFNFRFSTNKADVQPMLHELRHCRTLWRTAVGARQTYNRALGKRYLEIEQTVYPTRIAPDGREFGPPEPIRQQIEAPARNDPTVKALGDSVRQAKQAVADYVMGAATEYPIIWRLYQSTDVAAPDEVIGREAIAVLSEAFQANVDLAEELAEDPELVWRFPPVIRHTLASPELALPQLSIPWMAAEERLAKEGEPRFTQNLGLLVGGASLGVVAVGLAVGVSIISGPVGIALIVADAVISLIDAIQEYLAYQKQAAAFNAVLNPSLALANEPDWLSAAFTIALDLAALLPVR